MAGRRIPRGQHPAYIKQKRAKKAVRRQSRREHAEDRKDLVHLLTRCSGTIVPRSDGVRELKVLIDNELGETLWENHIKTNEDLVRLILDSSFVIENIRMKRYRDLRARIEAITRQLCYRIHMRRTSLAHPAVSVK